MIVNWDHQGGLKDKANGSFVTALDARTGEPRWRTDRDETTSWATPLLADYAGKTQLIVHGSKRACAATTQTPAKRFGPAVGKPPAPSPAPLPTPKTCIA